MISRSLGGLRIAAAAAALAVVLAVPSAAYTPFFSGVTHYTLKNGLTVILHDHPDLPIVTVAVGYNAGSIHEKPGKTGVSYLLEKLMMTAGSANVSPLEHISSINRVGGTLNANALEDQTLYYQTIPSNHLALALWLESDRMRTLDLSRDKFEKARLDLLEELRNRKASEPYLNSLQMFDELLFSDFSFGHSLLGEEADVRRLTLDDVRSFYDSLYTPSNAVLCISGQFNPGRVRELVARYFESLPAAKPPAGGFEAPSYLKAPFSRTIEDPLASAPAVFLGFRLSTPGSSDAPILTLLDFLLLRGRTSRLNRRLLNREAKIAFQLTGGIDQRFDRSAFKIFIVASQPQIQGCFDAVFSELEKIKRSFPSEAEIGRAKMLYRQDFLNRTATSLDRALFLIQSYWSLRAAGRTMDVLEWETERVLRVTSAQIVAIVNRYFTLDNCIILNIRMK